MGREPLLIALTAFGSALCWWPLILVPNLELPFYLPLSLCAGTIGLAVALSGKSKVRIAVAGVAGSYAGFLLGIRILPLGSDGIANSYLWLEGLAATLATAVISAVLIAALRKVEMPKSIRRPSWFAFVACVAFGPVALALTPSLASFRIYENERQAGKRVDALKNAARESMAENADPRTYCAGELLKSHYAGPAFSSDDWVSITKGYVTRDGYAFMVFCPEKGGYRISALPKNFEQDGNRSFCSDESGQAGCRSDGSFSILVR